MRSGDWTFLLFAVFNVLAIPYIYFLCMPCLSFAVCSKAETEKIQRLPAGHSNRWTFSLPIRRSSFIAKQPNSRQSNEPIRNCFTVSVLMAIRG